MRRDRNGDTALGLDQIREGGLDVVDFGVFQVVYIGERHFIVGVVTLGVCEEVDFEPCELECVITVFSDGVATGGWYIAEESTIEFGKDPPDLRGIGIRAQYLLVLLKGFRVFYPSVCTGWGEIHIWGNQKPGLQAVLNKCENDGC